MKFKIDKKENLYFDNRFLSSGVWLLDMDHFKINEYIQINGEFGGLIKAKKPFVYSRKELTLAMPRKGIAEGIKKTFQDAQNSIDNLSVIEINPTKVIVELDKQKVRVLKRKDQSFAYIDEKYYKYFSWFTMCQKNNNDLTPVIFRYCNSAIGLCLPLRDENGKIATELETIR